MLRKRRRLRWRTGKEGVKETIERKNERIKERKKISLTYLTIPYKE